MEYYFERLLVCVTVDPAWAQAYANIALVVLTLLTLIVLCLYACDTRRIASVSVEQLENAQMPFLELVKKDDPEMRHFGLNESLNLPIPDPLWWFIENQENSTAINIDFQCSYFHMDEEKTHSTSQSLNPVPAEGSVRLNAPSPAEDVAECVIEYGSLDGRRFATKIESKDGKLITQFIKL